MTIANPARAPTLQVALKRRLGGVLLETASLARAVPRRLRAVPVPVHRFVIFGRGRSGSTLLVSLLDAHPQITCAGEVLRLRTLAPEAHLRRILAEAHTPVSGAKLLSYQLRDIHRLPAGTDILRRLAGQGVTILYLTRDNLLRHAISNIYAYKQRIYHQTATGPVRPRITLGLPELTAWIEGSEALAAYEAQVLAGVPHRALTYEADLAQPEARLRTAAALLAEFALDPVPVDTRLRKVTSDDLREVIENHDSLIAALQTSRFARYLTPDAA